jgi:hypothetical protein
MKQPNRSRPLQLCDERAHSLTLPIAALVPWNVARTSVGNTSAATSQVVQLGPNWFLQVGQQVA